MGETWQVSVLTPIHNTSLELLKRAYDSLKNQSFGFSRIQWVAALHNCEPEYVRSVRALLGGIPNILLFEIEKEGSGVSFARNATLDRAEGTYLFFLDSDDELTPDCIERVVLEMEKGHADTAVFTVKIIGSWPIDNYYVDADPSGGTRFCDAGDPGIAKGMCTAAMGLGSRCYRLDLIRKEELRFDESIAFGEDLRFSVHATGRARRVCLLPQFCGYIYYAGIGMSSGNFADIDKEMRRGHNGPWGMEKRGLFLAALMEEGRSEGLDLSNFMWMQLAQFGRLFFSSDLPQTAKENYIETIRPLVQSLSEPDMAWKEKQPDVDNCCAFVRGLLKLSGRGGSHKYGYYLQYRTIPEAVTAFADRRKTAVICGSERLTYGELIRDAYSLAHSLNRSGIGRGDKVVLALSRSAGFITAFLGILYAGAAYVAVDPGWPRSRLEYIVRDSEAALVLTDEEYDRLLAEKKNEWSALPVLQGNDPFAVYYTSGSTGEPKGTVTHHQVFFHEAVPVEENICSFETMERCETFFSMGNFAYGATACDIAACLLYGKTLVFTTEEERADPSLLGRAMLTHHADALLGTPSMLLTYLEDPVFAEGFRSLKRLIVTGEALSVKDADRILDHTDAAVFDAFGASEIRNYAFTRVVRGEEVRLGDPIYGAKLLLLTEDGKDAEAGRKGELCVGGVPAFSGCYLGREELTSLKFRETKEYGRIYRTGDMAVRDVDGRITMTGREDDLIKFHGQRLEIREVERCIEEYPSVRHAAAAVRGSGRDVELWAWFTSEKDVDIYSLRVFMEDRLPAYMIPSRMRQLERLPLNSSGKLDKSALPDIEKQKGAYTAPETEVERQLSRAFEAVLDTGERIGREDHFFLLGGDSFKAMRLIHLLKENYGYTVTFPDIFRNPTPKRLADVLQSHGEHEGGIVLPPVRELPVSEIPEELRGLYCNPDTGLLNPETEAVLPASHSTALYLMMKRFGITNRRNVNRVKATLNCLWSEKEFRFRVEKLVQNHPSLRSEFRVTTEGTFWQVIYRQMEVPAYFKDVSGLSGEAAGRFVNGFWQVLEENDTPFAAACFVLPGRQSILLIRSDHTVADGVSVNVIQNELTAEDANRLRPDEYILHRKRSLASAGSVPDEVRNYYRNVDLSLLPSWSTGNSAQPKSALTFAFTAEETGRMSEFCAREGFTLHTLMQLVYGKTLMDLRGTQEIWLIHVDHGRHSEWGDELRIIGNLMTGIPVRIDRNTSGQELQKILLEIRQFAGLSDSSVLKDAFFRKCAEGIISQDFDPLNPLISESVMLDPDDVAGNAMRMTDGALEVLVREPYVCGSPETASRFRELFLTRLGAVS